MRKKCVCNQPTVSFPCPVHGFREQQEPIVSNWAQWYAWHPVRTVDGEWIWMRKCLRQTIVKEVIKFADSDGFCVESQTRYRYKLA